MEPLIRHYLIPMLVIECLQPGGALCYSHRLSGHEVLENIKDIYFVASLVANFEVSGGMFSSVSEAKRKCMGCFKVVSKMEETQCSS